jgi:hypothetical protein
VEVRGWIIIDFRPVKQNEPGIRVTHENLPEDINAVVYFSKLVSFEMARPRVRLTCVLPEYRPLRVSKHRIKHFVVVKMSPFAENILGEDVKDSFKI